MKKIMILAASAALVLAGCAKMQTIETNEGTPVNFGVYVPQMTKAGSFDQTTTASIQRAQTAGGGFGVFAYYTDNANYTSNSYYANFMYNQLVEYSSSAWTYAPVKYWPNEYGTGANSEGTDKLTFLAYAPYVTKAAADADASTGTGIVGMVTNAETKDAYVTYKVSTDPAKAVDLVWAVNNDNGFPFTDLTKSSQTITSTIPFKFKHALARLNVNVRGMYDVVRTTDDQESTNDIDDKTKITIGKIEIKGDFIPKAELNLKNTVANKPNWQNPEAAGEQTLVVANADVAASLKATSDSEVESSFPAIAGVTKTNVNVFTGAAPAATDTKFFTIIPKDGSQTFQVKITYFVTTEDSALKGGVSSVKNVIYKDVTFETGFEAQKNYSIDIALGMTTVKVTATVDDNWVNGDDPDVDLPVNAN